ncbi:hypothetical protein SporoP37_07255 [Sporosarcina sp. P37]|nr:MULTISPECIES: TRAP transporter substrate-binding protein DctP [unclassified Sporosarcina]ARD47961.1 hypothetical protein SporoP33_06780 [Sporosarcina sp. P33]ARK24486.1 hypothetical protein SporoP37_07255 [Sporosarcina sp. P37]PID18361.1 hypothetical protein CSV62_08900 [Sporosarcina sp. P35]
MNKKFITAILASFLLLVLTACGNSAESSDDAAKKDKVTLKFATAQSDTHSLTSEVFKPMMEEITERTDGQVEFDFYPAEQLGKAADLYDLTSDGVADISFYISTYYPDKMPITSSLIGIPGLYSTSYEGSVTYHEIAQKDPVLQSDFIKNGVRPILTYNAPAGELWTRGKEVFVPEDVKGMKIRTTGEVLNKATVALDATPVNITLSEMYEAFDRGVYDGINLNAQSLNDHGMGELVKYGTKGVNFGGSGTGLIINENVFQSLSEDVQKVILEVGEKYTKSNAERTDEYVESIFKEYKDKGIVIHEITEDEKAKWSKFFESVEQDWLKEKDNPEFEETLKAFKEKSKENK